MTGETPVRPQGYAVVAVVNNTFWAAPDWATQRYLRRADLKRALGRPSNLWCRINRSLAAADPNEK
jgi:hypothetical protein